MAKKQIDLSRRKLIAGLGTAGVAAAGAGLGTTAYLNDEESFEDNSISAGTLNMTVEAESVAVNDEYDSAVGPIDYLETADDDTALAGYTLNDFKPGDWCIIKYTVEIGNNPGWLTIHSSEISESAGNNEPGNGEKDLAEKLLLTHWNGTNTNDGSVNDRSDLHELSQTTDVLNRNPTEESWALPNEDGEANLNGTDVMYTDVLGFAYGGNKQPTSGAGPGIGDPLGNGYASSTYTGNAGGISIREGNGIGWPPEYPDDSYDNPYRQVGDSSSDTPDPVEFYQLIELPAEVGNEIQGDSLSFSLGFRTAQVRNTSDPHDSGASISPFQ